MRNLFVRTVSRLAWKSSLALANTSLTISTTERRTSNMPELEMFLHLIAEYTEEERIERAEAENRYYNPDLEIEDPIEF